MLQQIGFDGSAGSPWERLFKIGVGNIIITALGFVPGYYVSVLSIEYLGRKWIQVQGFLMAALFRESFLPSPARLQPYPYLFDGNGNGRRTCASETRLRSASGSETRKRQRRWLKTGHPRIVALRRRQQNDDD